MRHCVINREATQFYFSLLFNGCSKVTREMRSKFLPQNIPSSTILITPKKGFTFRSHYSSGVHPPPSPLPTSVPPLGTGNEVVTAHALDVWVKPALLCSCSDILSNNLSYTVVWTQQPRFGYDQPAGFENFGHGPAEGGKLLTSFI